MIRARLPRYKTDPRITCIPARIANDICIRVRITGIRVRKAMRGRIAEVVLGCSGHYIDPSSVGDQYSVLSNRARLRQYDLALLSVHESQ